MYQIKSNLGVTQVATLGDVLVYMNHMDSKYERPNESFESVKRDGTELEIFRSTSSRYGIRQPGSARTIIEAMITEVEVLYVKPGDKVLSPHEMLRSQWEAITAIGSAAYNVYPCFTREQLQESFTYVQNGKERQGSVEYLMNHLFYERFGYLHNGPRYQPTGPDNCRHDVHVAYALAQGKAVPEHVLEEYASNKEWQRGVSWLNTLIYVPALCGALPLEMLISMCTLLRNSGIELTVENAYSFIALMKEFPAVEANSKTVDDFLYSKGFLKTRELPAKREIDLGLPVNRFASDLFEALKKGSKDRSLKRLEADRARGHMPQREYDFGVLLADRYEGTYELPNRIAKAVQDKDVGFLLSWLDCSDDQNTTTKGVLHKCEGLKLRGVKAAARNKAIFAFCGYDDAAREQYLRDQEERKAKKKLESALKEAAERAEQIRYQVLPTHLATGPHVEEITGREYVDRAIAAGHTTLLELRKGKTKFWLANDASRKMHGLSEKDGTYDYAFLTLKSINANLVAKEAEKETAEA